MLGRRRAARVLVAAVAPLMILIGGGCATAINHSYDPSTNFGALKSYAWAPGPAAAYSQSSLVEANVQFLADPLLAKKGFTRATATPDFVILVRLENYPVGSVRGLRTQDTRPERVPTRRPNADLAGDGVRLHQHGRGVR